ncbi:MAG: PH domain-containing protein, partial [Bacteroidota bacterium]
SSLLVGGLVLVVLSLLNFLLVKKSYLSINEDLIKVGGGTINTTSEFLAIHKIQSVSLRSTIFQRLNNHADLVLYTASGSVKVEYLPYVEAKRAFNMILYKIESSNKNWI